MSTHVIYVDGVVRVQAGMCDTCIFRPGNLMHLAAGRVKGMVDDCLREESVIPCHKTLELPKQAICRGFYDLWWHRNWVLRLARIMQIIEEVPL